MYLFIFMFLEKFICNILLNYRSCLFRLVDLIRLVTAHNLIYMHVYKFYIFLSNLIFNLIPCIFHIPL